MKILITGGSGLVGSAIKSLSKNNDKHQFIFLNSKDCDLKNFEDTNKLFKEINPEYIIHLAACVGGLYKNLNNKVQMLEDNLLINFNVLKSAHLNNIQNCISCLSTCIFPDNTTYPINEDMLHDGKPHDSNYSYAYAKRLLEIHSRAYCEQYGRNYICVIPTNIYGPNDNFNLQDAHVIPALIHKCYLAKKNNSKFVVMGSGKPLRQFIYSEDLAKLIVNVIENYNGNQSLILSVGDKNEISIRDVALLIANEFDYEKNLVFDTYFEDGQYKKTADNTKLIKLIGNYKFKSIQNGIKETIDWFKNNYKICRK